MFKYYTQISKGKIFTSEWIYSGRNVSYAIIVVRFLLYPRTIAAKNK